MQQWSKYQFQSRNLQKEIFFIVFVIGLFLIPPEIYAQVSMIGTLSEEEKQSLLSEIPEILIENQKLEFTIGKHGDVHVKHIIDLKEGWGNSNPKMIQILPGGHSNLDVTDNDGDSYAFTYDRDTLEKSQYVILQQKLGAYDLLVEYDLENFLELDDNVWSKQIKILTDVKILFDEDIDMIFANGRPINVGNADGINCIGCQMELEIINDEKITTEKIFVNDSEETINIISNGKISNFEFNQDINEIYFQTEKNNQILVLEIPKNVLLYPFDVYATQGDDIILDQLDKIRNTEFEQNDKTAKTSIRPNSPSNISIIGATQERHDAVFAKVEQQRIMQEERQREVLEANKPQESEKEADIKNINPEEIYSEWGVKENSTADNTLVFAIIGIIAAIVIGIIVVKLKK